MRLPHPGSMAVDDTVGNFTYSVEDFTIPCRGGLKLQVARYYDSDSEHGVNSVIGPLAGWCFNFDERLRFEYSGTFSPLPGQDAVVYPGAGGAVLGAVSVVMADRSIMRYTYQKDGTFVGVDAWNPQTLAQNADGTFTLTIPGQGIHTFYNHGRLRTISDLFGNTITYTWKLATQLAGLGVGMLPGGLFLASITDPGGRVIQAAIRMVNGDMIYTLTDWSGRQWAYTYGFNATTLTAVTDADGNTTSYIRYDSSAMTVSIPSGVTVPGEVPSPLVYLSSLAQIDFPNGTFLVNYASGLRPLGKQVGLQIFGNRLAVNRVYNPQTGLVTRLVGSGAETTSTQYDPSTRRTTGAVDSLGNTYAYKYDSDNRITQSVNPRLGVKSFAYDSRWNVISSTDALGNTTTMEYHPVFNLPTKITTPGPTPQTTTMTYDPTTGVLLSKTDALGGRVAYQYDSFGQVVSVTGKRGEIWSWTYDPVSGDRLTQTDPLGNVSSVLYDAVGRIVATISAEGRVARCTLSPCGLMTSYTDQSGNTHTMKYDGNRNLVSHVDALGNETRWSFNALNEMTQKIDAMGGVTTYNFSEKGELASTVDVLGRVTAMQHDALGRVTQTTNALGQSTTTAYTSDCGTITVTDALGRTSSSSRDLNCRVTLTTQADGSQSSTVYNADDTVHSTTDALGHTTTFVTDALRRVVSQTDALGRTVSRSYDASGNVTSTTDARGFVTSRQFDLRNRQIGETRPDGSRISYSYTPDGLLASVTDARGKVWSTRYDLNGRPVMRIDPLGHRQITVYDALGRVLQTVSPSGRTASMQWDALGRQVAATDPMGFSSTRLYDAAGKLLAVYDPLGRATYMTYDALNREVQRVDPSGGITSTTFDAAGQIVAVSDANGNTTGYEFDLRGRVVAEIYPDGSRLSYTWDSNGNMLSKQDPRTSQGPLSGSATIYRYDAANQLVNIVLWDGAQVTLAYDGAGNVVERHDNGGDFQFVYDSMNRPQQIIQNGQVYQIHYDPDGRRLSVIFPDGRTTSAAYDDAGRLSTVVTPDLGSTLLTYDFDNRRTAVSYPNGSSALAAYDLNSRLVRLVHQNSKGTAITPDFRLTYDGVGNIVAVNDAATPLWTYSMDSLDRLISATNHTLSQTTSWTYDAVGNRLTETVGGVTTGSVYNKLNQLIQMGNTKLFWDANGNLAQKYDPSAGVTTYRFDSRDRLVQVELPDAQQIVYNYDQMGRMITRTDNTGTTTFEWNGWDLEREIAPSGSVTRYFYNGSEMVGFSKDDQHFRVHADWLGSVRTVTDPTGAIVFTADYDVWGNPVAVTDSVPGGFAYRWVGGFGVRWDDGAKLYYMRNRFYDFRIGRFVSRDPLKNSPYIYVENAPTTSVDPQGLFRVYVYTRPDATVGNIVGLVDEYADIELYSDYFSVTIGATLLEARYIDAWFTATSGGKVLLGGDSAAERTAYMIILHRFVKLIYESFTVYFSLPDCSGEIFVTVKWWPNPPFIGARSSMKFNYTKNALP